MNKSRATLFGCFLLALLFFSCSSPEPESKAEESQKENKFEEVEKKLEELEEQSDEEWTFDTAPSDLTLRDPSELSSFDIPPNVDELPKTKPETTDDLPPRFDWRDTQGVVGRVQDQGECSSCWAFGACSIAESVYAINGTSFVDISEQWLIDCNTEGWGCVGGLIALSYFVDQADSCGEVGAVTETAAPYTHRDGDCHCGTERMTPLPAWGVISTENHPASVETIKRAIKENGPIIAVIDIDLPFLAYQGGIYNWNSLFRFPQSHLVVLTGWDDTQGINGIWFLRNSFGPMWGEAGTMRIEYGTAGVARFAASFTKSSGGGAAGSEKGGGGSAGAGAGRISGEEESGVDNGEGNSGGARGGESSGGTVQTGASGGSAGSGSEKNTNSGLSGGGSGAASDSEEFIDEQATLLNRRFEYLDDALEGQAEGVSQPIPEGANVDVDALKIDPDAIGTNNPALFGVWVQTGRNNGADTAPGGYKRSYLLISPSGLLEFVRFYDSEGELRTVTRLDWHIDGSNLILGEDKELQKGRMRRNLTVPIGDTTYTIVTPATKLPAELKWSLQFNEKKTLALDGKTYKYLRRE